MVKYIGQLSISVKQFNFSEIIFNAFLYEKRNIVEDNKTANVLKYATLVISMHVHR